MKKLLLSSALLSSLVLSSATVLAQETDVKISFVEESSLTAEQKVQVINGAPTNVVKVGDEFTLVYVKTKEGVADQATTLSVATATTIENKAVLPNTGENVLPVALLSVLTLAAGSYLIYRNKKTGKYIVLVLIGGSLVAPMSEVLAQMNEIAPSITVKAEVGAPINYLPKEIEGYDYIGYLVTTQTASTSSITVKDWVTTTPSTVFEEVTSSGEVVTTNGSTSVSSQTAGVETSTSQEGSSISANPSTETESTSHETSKIEFASWEAPETEVEMSGGASDTTDIIEADESTAEETLPTEVITNAEPSESEALAEAEVPSESEAPAEAEVPSESEVPIETEEPRDNEVPAEMGSLKAQVQMHYTSILNDYRASLGLNPVTFTNRNAAGGDVRASEIISVFSHSRPNGADWSTAFDQSGLGYGWSEIIAMATGISNDPSVIAAHMFEQWKNSPGHHATMTNPNYNEVYLGVELIETPQGITYYGVGIFTNN